MSKIRVSIDGCGTSTERDAFVAWLISKGHDAGASDSTGSYVDGRWTSSDDDAQQTLNALWDEFCAQ